MNRTRAIVRVLWGLAAVAALLIPAVGGTLLDGMPLDSPVDAILIGMAVPVLFALDRSVFDKTVARILVSTLLVTKVAAAALLAPQGFCTTFRTDGPVRGPVEAIEFDEPAGLMRSWDVRAHWGAGTPACSAITRRDYATRLDFPAWFVNLVESANPPRHELNLDMRGIVTVSESGRLAFGTLPEMRPSLTADDALTMAGDGRVEASLTPGSHRVELRARVSGGEWRVVPSWNGQSLWSSALVTRVAPSSIDVALWRVLPMEGALLSLALIGYWFVVALRASPLDRASIGWLALASLAAVFFAWVPMLARFAPLAIGVVIVASVARRNNVTPPAATWLIAVPWLVFAGALAARHVGEFSLYTRGNDWLTYQISAYRIYLYGFWLEAGEKLFYYQPLYRWIAGALHLAFGDSSAGELFWDGACLTIGALLAFSISKSMVGAQAAVVISMTTLAVFTLTPIWYLIGRGLAEISAAGFAWAAALLLSRARTSGLAAVIGAGVFAVLAFYARLNQMLFAGALLVFLLPLETPSRALRHPAALLRSIRASHIAAYVAVLATGVALLALRAWFYTGQPSVFAGTSFGLNHTGLAPSTLLSLPVWRSVSHSLFAEMIVNEVFDPRGLLVYAGCVTAALALLQVPVFSRIPLVASVSVIGALAGALVAHAHGYPGRFSVHLVPLATTSAMLAALTALSRWHARARRHAPSAVAATGAPQATSAR